MNAPVPFDVAAIRKDFPCLSQEVHGKPLIYLDSAASAQIPTPVVEAIVGFHTRDRSNIHRGVHELSQRASAAYDAVRDDVARFLGGVDAREVVFVRGTTEAINLVAQTWGLEHIGEGDEIAVTAMEHHANIVPWQLLAKRTGARLVVLPMDDRGVLDLDAARRLIGPRTKLLGVVAVSNALGTINPVRTLADLAHAQGAVVLVDGAQLAPHARVDVHALGADFFCFSGHKTVGPSGVGVLWGRYALLDAMPPWQGGGDMIANVTFAETTFNEVPLKFEAGTPNVAGVIGLGAALRYLEGLGMARIAAWEAELLAHATAAFGDIPRVVPVGTAPDKAGVFSFTVEGAHASDVGMLLDQAGVAIRTGHHCAQPVMDFFGVSATARASFAFYNTKDEIDAAAAALRRILSWL